MFSILTSVYNDNDKLNGKSIFKRGLGKTIINPHLDTPLLSLLSV